MANYIFESMTASDAAAFTSSDYLIFISSGANASNVTVAPYTGSGSGSLATSGIDLTYGGKTLTFPDALSAASQTSNNQIIFNDSSHLVIGSNDATAGNGDTLTSTSTATGAQTVVYGLAGNDTITGGDGADYIYGGTGNDTFTGTTSATGANYHIYGNAGGSPAALATGVTDADTITVTNGSSYIQGNAGNDTIAAGTATSTGFNRIFGGGDNDTITLNGALGAHASVNGNKGADTINAGGSGTYEIRGGQGNDTIIQTGTNHSTIMGDVGADTLTASTTAGHIAVFTGGADADVFNFGTAGAGARATIDATGAVSATGTTYYQEITDFTQGVDHITLPTAITSASQVGYAASASTVFGSVDDAATFAATQVGTGGVVVSSLQVGTASSNSTYLFYDDNGATANTAANLGVIHLDGVTASTIVGGSTAATSSFT